MRTRRINRTVLVEEQTAPDRRTKTLPPNKPQPKANLRYCPPYPATSSNSPNKMNLRPYPSLPKIMSRSLIPIPRGPAPSCRNILDASAIYAGTCSDVPRNWKSTPTIQTSHPSSKSSGTRRKSMPLCYPLKRRIKKCWFWIWMKLSFTLPSPSQPNTTSNQTYRIPHSDSLQWKEYQDLYY